VFAAEPVSMKHPLRALRQERRLAIYGLAARAQCSPTTIGAVERWGYRPSAAVCERLAAALDVPVEVIWPEQGRMMPKRTPGEATPEIRLQGHLDTPDAAQVHAWNRLWRLLLAGESRAEESHETTKAPSAGKAEGAERR
jgi:DNA-binding XRE family transcriptional regulator